MAKKCELSPQEFVELFNEFVIGERAVNRTSKELGISYPTIKKYFQYLCCDHGIPHIFFEKDYKGSCYTCNYISLHKKICSCPLNRGRTDLDLNKGCENWQPIDGNLKVEWR